MGSSDSIAKVSKIIGPPGTGKTTEVLRLVEAAAEKYGAANVGAVSYTKAAVEEIRDRAVASTGVTKGTAQNIRTIHSHCFKMLDIKKDQVADTKIKDWNDAYPQLALPLVSNSAPEDNGYSIPDNSLKTKENQKSYARMRQLRKRLVPKDKWDGATRRFHEAWKHWMYIEDLTDFTGMVEKAVERQLVPEIDILFVDETQDLAPLELMLMEQWTETVVSTVFVGDSDQCIYRFAGAVPEAFVNLPHDWGKTLDQSYRVPVAVQDYANKVIHQARDREQVTWKPTDTKGSFNYGFQPSLQQTGSHMLLARCNYHVKSWRQLLAQQGVAWHNPYRPSDLTLNPQRTSSWRAVRAYKLLEEDKPLAPPEFKNLVKAIQFKGGFLERGIKTMIAGHAFKQGEVIKRGDLLGMGFKEKFLEFDKDVMNVLRLTGQARLLAASTPFDRLLAPPRLVLGTIHSVKGGEADNVWLDNRTSSLIMNAWRTDDTAKYDEARVAYVGCTRARKNLTILRQPGLVNPALV